MIDTLHNPVDRLPAVYRRLPTAPNYVATHPRRGEPKPLPDPKRSDPKKSIKAALQAAYDVHARMWSEFTRALRPLFEPYPDLVTQTVTLMDDFNRRFAAPLAEVGWHP